MITTQDAAKEFTASMNKAIEKMAKENSCPEDQIQIALELGPKDNNIYKVCKNFAHVKTVELKDILFVSFIYTVFRAMIADKITKCLKSLSTQNESNFITVFIMKSKLPWKIRIMLYVKGAYAKELTAEQIVSLNN